MTKKDENRIFFHNYIPSDYNVFQLDVFLPVLRFIDTRYHFQLYFV